MIDMFTLLLVHGLIFIALFRLMSDNTLDREDAAAPAAEPQPEKGPTGA